MTEGSTGKTQKREIADRQLMPIPMSAPPRAVLPVPPIYRFGFGGGRAPEAPYPLFFPGANWSIN
ncbi:hypothetical protein K8R04_03640 [Candidatus Uhrbacteria bacterium]|nr:hypothetical protein [Candidatus Uhrbacteria bacterium]